jgi:aspartate/glutamate racemase
MCNKWIFSQFDDILRDMEKTYGVLGGYGAPAGLHLHQEIIEQTLATKGHTDLDFPRFILTNLPYNIMTETGEIQDKKQFILANVEANKAFTAATDVLILCNSFHRYLNLMENIYGGKLINLPQRVAQEAVDRGHRKPLLVSSTETIQSGLYKHEDYDLQTYYSPELIESGMKTEEPVQSFIDKVLAEAEACGADSIIMGCTDLNMYAKRIRTQTQLPVMDSVEIAATIIVEGK